jgi:hypothetical protein
MLSKVPEGIVYLVLVFVALWGNYWRVSHSEARRKSKARRDEVRTITEDGREFRRLGGPGK